MNNTNTKSIIFNSGILTILALGVMTMPLHASADRGGYIVSYPKETSSNEPADNPKPTISSISPSSSNVGIGTKTVTINGEGFVPSSIARINGANRTTTFIDSSHLLVQITGNDTYAYRTNGGFFITVFNRAPGGGYSNAASFKINNSVSSGGENYNPVNDTSSNFTDTSVYETSDSNEYSDLAANAILGSNSLLPSGIIQWIVVAILVLVIVILVRRVYGADKKYHAKPLKHS